MFLFFFLLIYQHRTHLFKFSHLSLSQTVFRIVVLGIWDYIENKVEVSSGILCLFSILPMPYCFFQSGPFVPRLYILFLNY